MDIGLLFTFCGTLIGFGVGWRIGYKRGVTDAVHEVREIFNSNYEELPALLRRQAE
jgi:ABC-type dipeptide/oligopeptide/nickel transport system permease subunit